MNHEQTMARLVLAQKLNGLLGGDALTDAARTAAAVADRLHCELIAVDGAGERIIGAALALAPGICRPADLTRRLDARSLLVISGAVAGSIGLAHTAARLRSLGAHTVHAAVLGGWPDDVPGVETITALGALYIDPAMTSFAA
jgi:hypothetical protein